MPRRRLAVALLAPVEQAHEVDVLRRAVGVPEPFHVAPHITLVPPLNVSADGDTEVGPVLRRAAAGARPFRLVVGPAASFAPETPTLHLAVGGDGADLAALRSVRAAARTGVLDRPDVWPFTPHVTLREEHPVDRIAESVRTLSGVRQEWSVDRLHLLEQRRRDDGSPCWEPVAEEPFGGPAVVGRGGIELPLRTVGMVEQAVADLTGLAPAGPLPGPSRPRPLAVVAEAPGHPGIPIGAAVGSTAVGGAARLDALTVADAHRAHGVGRHLLAAWCSAAAARGVDVVAAEDADDGFLVRHGFAAAAGLLLRRL